MSVDLLEGTQAAPPRDNGELIFSEPWQARAFGLAAELAYSDFFTWDEFRVHLIESIAAWESAHEATRGSVGSGSGTTEAWDYYRCWLVALENAVTAHGLTSRAAIERRTHEYASRPAGHDH